MVPPDRDCYAPYPDYKYPAPAEVPPAIRPSSAKPRLRYAPSFAGWRRLGDQRFIKGTDGIQHAEYRIQPVLMHDANIGGKTAGNPDHRDVKAQHHPRHPHRHFAVDRLAIRYAPSPVITKSASATRSASCSASVTISMPGRNWKAPQNAYSAAPMPPRRAATLKAQHVDIVAGDNPGMVPRTLCRAGRSSAPSPLFAGRTPRWRLQTIRSTGW